MTWFKLDVDWMDHPNIVGLSPMAQLLWLKCLTYANRHSTDGFVPIDALAVLAPYRKRTEHVLELCSKSLLCEHEGDGKLSRGYTLRSFLDHNRSRAEVESDRAKSAERKRKQRAAAVAVPQMSHWDRNGCPTGTETDVPLVSHKCHAARVEKSRVEKNRSEHPPTPLKGDCSGPDVAGTEPPKQTSWLEGPTQKTEGHARRAKKPKPKPKVDLDVEELTEQEQRVRSAILGDPSLGDIVVRPCLLARDLTLAGPGLDVALCCQQAGGWLRSNPGRAKTYGNRFLLNWIVREQNRNGGRGANANVVPIRGPARQVGIAEHPPVDPEEEARAIAKLEKMFGRKMTVGGQ